MTAVVALVLAAALLPGGVAATGQAGRGNPPASYFGMHYGAVSSAKWPRASIGSIRLWDTGTAWKDIEPARGIYRWRKLDRAVHTARRNGAAVNLVLGLTPRWASSRPGAASIYGPGFGSPPKQMRDWSRYVHAVASRYAGRIASYEVWNEAETCGFYCGTPAQLAEMARRARFAVRSADPRAVMLSPSLVPFWFDQPDWATRPWVEAYAAAQGFRWADVVSVHAYARHREGPEAEVAMVDHYRQELADLGIRKPIWNTEMNFEANLRDPVRLDGASQSAYVARVYLLSWGHGIRQVAWYDWSASENLGIRMTSQKDPARA